MMLRALSLAVISMVWSGCASTAAVADPAMATATADAVSSTDPAAAAKAKQEARHKQEKELRDKLRELENVKLEQQVAALDQKNRREATAAALQRASDDLEAARRELEVFVQDVKPRELDDHRISLDGSTYRAEHSKDELGELTAMYEADEFARQTKELVLKRGRREMEMADRRLAVEKREFTHFEQFELPQRERELRNKLADAELARRKAESEVEKARLELELAAKKAGEQQSDLEAEVRELQAALAKDREQP